MSIAAAPSIMERLKAETADLHAAAETHEFQKNLVKGELAQDAYARWLGQMFLIHRALERRLRDLSAKHAGAAALVRERHMQEPYLREDLAHFGADPDSIAPLDATQRLIERIERAWMTDPVALLGFHYVLEGSNNGNKFIAKALQRALGLQPGPGLRYLDPYGDDQRAVWSQFREDMNAIDFDARERDAVVEAAKDLFRAIGELSSDLVAACAPSGAAACAQPPRPRCPHAAGR